MTLLLLLEMWCVYNIHIALMAEILKSLKFCRGVSNKLYENIRCVPAPVTLRSNRLVRVFQNVGHFSLLCPPPPPRVTCDPHKATHAALEADEYENQAKDEHSTYD